MSRGIQVIKNLINIVTQQREIIRKEEKFKTQELTELRNELLQAHRMEVIEQRRLQKSIPPMERRYCILSAMREGRSAKEIITELGLGIKYQDILLAVDTVFTYIYCPGPKSGEKYSRFLEFAPFYEAHPELKIDETLNWEERHYRRELIRTWGMKKLPDRAYFVVSAMREGRSTKEIMSQLKINSGTLIDSVERVFSLCKQELYSEFVPFFDANPELKIPEHPRRDWEKGCSDRFAAASIAYNEAVMKRTRIIMTWGEKCSS